MDKKCSYAVDGVPLFLILRQRNETKDAKRYIIAPMITKKTIHPNKLRVGKNTMLLLDMYPKK